MNPFTHFFLLYIVICLSIILLFYYLFKRSEVHPNRLTTKKTTPYEFLRKKMNKGIPGMDKTEVGKPLSMPDDPLRRKVNKGEVEKPLSTPYDFLRKKMNKGVPGMDQSDRGKPLPAPKMPVAPVPLVVQAVHPITKN